MSRDFSNGCAFLYLVGWLIMIICWINNIIDLIYCDFEAPFNEEVIHAIGIVVPPASLITCWF
jgi:hypothetical protein